MALTDADVQKQVKVTVLNPLTVKCYFACHTDFNFM